MGQTINQVRHLYVVKETPTTGTPTAVGGVGVKTAGEGKNKTMYFQYMSPAGLVGTDKIAVENIMYAKVTKATAMKYGKKVKKVVLSEDADVVAGQEYILRLTFRQYIGLGDNDVTFKYGMAVATTKDTAEGLYKKIALSLAKNVAKDTTALAKVYVDAALTQEVTATMKSVDEITATADGIYVEEVEQDWSLGKMPVAYIPFEVNTLPITYEGVEVNWGTVTNINPVNKVGNGKNIADLEYFCMGARGDYYRGMGYPNNIETEYLVDPTKEYDVLDIHYAYTGSNESSQKSEKDITFVAQTGTLITTLEGLVESASGISIEVVE